MEKIISTHRYIDCKCKACGEEFLFCITDHENPILNLFSTKPICPECGSEDVEFEDSFHALVKRLQDL